jgi:hypothetical protein
MLVWLAVISSCLAGRLAFFLNLAGYWMLGKIIPKSCDDFMIFAEIIPKSSHDLCWLLLAYFSLNFGMLAVEFRDAWPALLVGQFPTPSRQFPDSLWTVP